MIGIVSLVLLCVPITQYYKPLGPKNLQWSCYARRLEKGCSIQAPINPKGWFVKINTGKQC
jgi:hypothetical protein